MPDQFSHRRNNQSALQMLKRIDPQEVFQTSSVYEVAASNLENAIRRHNVGLLKTFSKNFGEQSLGETVSENMLSAVGRFANALAEILRDEKQLQSAIKQGEPVETFRASCLELGKMASEENVDGVFRGAARVWIAATFNESMRPRFSEASGRLAQCSEDLIASCGTRRATEIDKFQKQVDGLLMLFLDKERDWNLQRISRSSK